MKPKYIKSSRVAVTNLMLLSLLLLMTGVNNQSYAQAAPIDLTLEVFRIRCQIDEDIDPDTGLMVPKVQIQAKARAEILDGYAVGIMVENQSRVVPPLPSVVNTVFELGTATADWDTFPDPDSLSPVSTISGDFVTADELIKITAQVTSTGQTVTGSGQCADKTSSQFRQDTKNQCTMKKYLLDKCKSGDVLPDGTIVP
jgi:hypothetical protein